MGIIFSGMFAIGLVIFMEIETDLHLLHVLFSSPIMVHKGNDRKNIWEISIFCLTTYC